MKQIKRIVSKTSLPAIFTMLAKRFESDDAKPIVMILRPLDKSHEQLGYLHSTVLPMLMLALYEAGEINSLSEAEAKYYLKVLINYGEWVQFRKAVVFVPYSFEKASIEILSKAIDEGIKQCEMRGGNVPPPKAGLSIQTKPRQIT